MECEHYLYSIFFGNYKQQAASHRESNRLLFRSSISAFVHTASIHYFLHNQSLLLTGVAQLLDLPLNFRQQGCSINAYCCFFGGALIINNSISTIFKFPDSIFAANIAVFGIKLITGQHNSQLRQQILQHRFPFPARKKPAVSSHRK